jgi:hypothetical protein
MQFGVSDYRKSPKCAKAHKARNISEMRKSALEP